MMARRTKRVPDLALYAGKWVALSSNRVVAVGSSLPEVMRNLPLRRPRETPSVFLVPRRDEGPHVLGRLRRRSLLTPRHQVMWLMSVCLMSSVTCAGWLSASTVPEERVQEVSRLAAAGRMEEAVALLQRLHREYPDDPSAAVTLGDVYGKQQRYAESVRYYEEGLARLRQAGVAPKTLAIVHNELANTYNELGQQRYFSAELCLRILYHLEQTWPFLVELGYRPDSLSQIVEFARKTVGHYDMASIGPNVRMRELSSQEEVAASANQDESELILSPDGIDEAAKRQAKDAIAARIRAFDQAQPLEYALAPSDRPLPDVLEALDAASRRITSLHYRKHRAHEGAEELAEETWYRHPEILKTHRHEGKQDAWFIIRDGRVTTFDPAQRKIFSQEPVEDEPGWLMEVRKARAKYLLQGYEFTVQKLTAPPAFVGSLYREHPASPLYLLTGKSKDPGGLGWPPVVKVEYVVDVDRGLLVGVREYWHGVLGSGREEELATTDVITQWTEYAGSLYLPVEGTRDQLVDELPGHRIDHTTWRIDYLHVNEGVEAGEFDLSRYAAEDTPTLSP